jgi:hypothetical protein
MLFDLKMVAGITPQLSSSELRLPPMADEHKLLVLYLSSVPF